MLKAGFTEEVAIPVRKEERKAKKRPIKKCFLKGFRFFRTKSRKVLRLSFNKSFLSL